MHTHKFEYRMDSVFFSFHFTDFTEICASTGAFGQHDRIVTHSKEKVKLFLIKNDTHTKQHDFRL